MVLKGQIMTREVWDEKNIFLVIIFLTMMMMMNIIDKSILPSKGLQGCYCIIFFTNEFFICSDFITNKKLRIKNLNACVYVRSFCCCCFYLFIYFLCYLFTNASQRWIAKCYIFTDARTKTLLNSSLSLSHWNTLNIHSHTKEWEREKKFKPTDMLCHLKLPPSFSPLPIAQKSPSQWRDFCPNEHNSYLSLHWRVVGRGVQRISKRVWRYLF